MEYSFDDKSKCLEIAKTEIGCWIRFLEGLWTRRIFGI